jgi:hypothetical protein
MIPVGYLPSKPDFVLVLGLLSRDVIKGTVRAFILSLPHMHAVHIHCTY